MTDTDVTLPEIYRVVKAIDGRLEKSIEDRERAEHSIRNRLEATNLKVAVNESRITAVETDVKDIYANAGKFAGAVSTVIGLLFSGLSLFWTRK